MTFNEIKKEFDDGLNLGGLGNGYITLTEDFEALIECSLTIEKLEVIINLLTIAQGRCGILK